MDQSTGGRGDVGRMRGALERLLAGRPHWMNALMLFCAYMALIYVPWDFFAKPAAVDEEVWFGIVLRGTWAKATEPLHWAIYAGGAWGFLRMRPWMWPWAAVYTGQIAIAMLVWAVHEREGLLGWGLGLASAAPFVALAVALYRARSRFQLSTAQST